jgi:alpha-ribazole phosphatase
VSLLPPGVTTRLIVIRHAEPEASAQGRCYGKLDVGLSPRGVEQATTLTRHPALAGLTRVLASPRRRALDTAGPLADAASLRVEVDARLAEIDFGAIEGQSYEQVEQERPELYAAWMSSPTTVRFPGGESFTDLRHRLETLRAELLAAPPGGVIALVAHGGTGRALIAGALGMPDAAVFRLEQRHASPSVLDYYGAEPVLRSLNEP